MELHELIKKARKGDADAFAQLMENRKEKIYRIAYGYTKNRENALEIVSEAIYRAFISINKLKEPEHFNTWLIRILINCALNYINKSNKLLQLDMAIDTEAKKEAVSEEEIIDLYTAIDKLDEKHKTIIMLKYIEDLTIPDIAKILNWPVGTVKTYLNRALKKLKIELEETYNE
jgi:RNA polymerase sigma-70 factor, ECF subfamily